jgi:hypothetical protein
MRIFLTSSHFSTILMTAYARTAPGDGKDFLILDAGRRKLSNMQQMKMAGSLHTWNNVFDFSEIFVNENEPLPGLTKRITWRVKNLPLFRPVYKILLRNYQRKKNRKKQEKLRSLLGTFDENEQVQLFLLKETGLNDALTGLFRNSTVSYFEHGSSDYLLMINDPPKGQGKFYCVFSQQFKRFLEKRQLDPEYVLPFANEHSFRKICDDYFSVYPEQVSLLQSLCSPGKIYALVILQPFENIMVDSRCWEDFLDRCTRITEKQQDIYYIIKPHPLQSKKETETVRNYFTRHGLQFIVSEDDTSVISIELAFSILQKQVKYVFSPYSSALFYLSALFPDEQTKYYFAYEYMRPYLREAPSAYYTLYDTAGPMIKEVFSEKCAEI